MGAGQIGGIATLLDIDFDNAAGFLGEKADTTEAQFIVHYLSHAMLFCVGALIEAHVVLTPAVCVFGETYKFDVIGGTHRFLEHTGATRSVHHFCVHKGLTGACALAELKVAYEFIDYSALNPTNITVKKVWYNHTLRYKQCSPDNIALLVLSQQYSFNNKDYGMDFTVNRIRYGLAAPKNGDESKGIHCRYYGWGSRRNGYVIPLLIHIQRMDVVVLPQERCRQMWNYQDKYLCIQQPTCKSERYGALCPNDLGTVIECSGFARGMMTSRMIDRPCGIGYLDLTKYNKFLTCGVDDSRDVIDHEDVVSFEFNTLRNNHLVPTLVTVEKSVENTTDT